MSWGEGPPYQSRLPPAAGPAAIRSTTAAVSPLVIIRIVIRRLQHAEHVQSFGNCRAFSAHVSHTLIALHLGGRRCVILSGEFAGVLLRIF